MAHRREPVSIGDIRDLVLHLVADGPPQSWLRVENPKAIQKVVVLLVPGLTPSLLDLPAAHAKGNPNLPLLIPAPDPKSKTQVPFVASTFMHACPTRAPGETTKMHSILSSFFMAPVSGEEKKKRILERISSERQQHTKNHDPMPYILTPEQMIDNDYPIPSYLADVFTKPSGWVETPCRVPYSHSSSVPPKVYALDCEMCMTEDGKDLTRICVIDLDEDKVVYDELVKPHKTILDYLTRWSGITAEKLHHVTKTLPEVQTDLLKMFTAPDDAPDAIPILLGHSLESDLRAMKLCHPRCIDTAVIYHHPRGRPLKPGLAWLTRKWCGREIQTGGEGGHDPEEDARACAQLLKLKFENGPGFGEFKTDQESILEKLLRTTGRSGRTVTSAVIDYGNPGSWHGAKATTAIACKSDEDVMRGVLESLPRHDFVFGRMIALSEALEWTTPKANAPVPTTPPPPRPPLAETAANLNSYLKQIFESLPPRTAFILFSGHSDPRTMSQLNVRKTKFETEIRAGKRLEEIDKADWWSAQEGRELETAVEMAKKGLLFLCIRNG
ncbi:ribonuclease H-like protein [Exidia glandulosa HHB12029]|uniref:Ribonuclease H-like protein n=1 Tax=Exidia glandulosa HHB12029 TaxID=1314781 RepID=A0A165PZK1_EXIGL|nr:ribonuclease H-like protein [Exidia glandulosa HHB12029]